MPEWTKDVTERELRYALQNVYMLAKKKRTIVYQYLPDDTRVPIGPKSDDADWDHIIRFCESVGLELSILRAQKNRVT